MRQMDLSKLRYFYVIAQEGNITRAAEKLNISQPALTTKLNTLEYEANAKLFDRLRHGVRLTPQGERLFAHAKKILEEHEAFERHFHEKEDEISGELKIVTTPFVGSEWLVPNLEGFLKRFPEIRIKIFLTSDNIQFIEGDVAICTFIPYQPHLIQRELFKARIRLFASPSYLRQYGIPQTIEDLDDHHIITYRSNYYTTYGSTNWLVNLGKEKGMPRESYFEINSLHGMLKSALQGYGIVELPDYSVVLKSGLKEVLPNVQGEEIPLYYSFLKNRASSKKINLLFNYLIKKSR